MAAAGAAADRDVASVHTKEAQVLRAKRVTFGQSDRSLPIANVTVYVESGETPCVAFEYKARARVRLSGCSHMTAFSAGLLHGQSLRPRSDP